MDRIPFFGGFYELFNNFAKLIDILNFGKTNQL